MAFLLSSSLHHAAAASASAIVASCSCSHPTTTSFACSSTSSTASFLRFALYPSLMMSSRLHAHPPPISEFDTAAFEADRLRQDAQARLDMMRVSKAAEEAAAGQDDADAASASASATADDGGWKWSIRKRIWDLMELENIAQHPRPVHHRIPNFVGASAAAQQLASLPAFEAAKCVKVNPDTPQKQVRFLTLQGNKKLLTPQPRLRTGFFSELEATSLPSGAIAEACSAAGVAKYGKPLGIDAKLKVDLIVIGSVAVDPKTGARLGKGEGFAELEYAMLRYMGAIDDSTLIVTSIHDKQLVDDIPVEKLRVHDVPVDIICTPTQVIYTNTSIPKPKGIYWELLSPEKLKQIRVLQELKKKIETETGKKLPSGPSEKLPPVAERRPIRQRVEGAVSGPTIFLWNLDICTTWKELQEHISKAGAEPLRINIIRKDDSSKPMARVLLRHGTDTEGLVKALNGSKLRKSNMNAKLDAS